MNSLIVGIGASAGGLEALNRLLGQVEETCNITFVISQHLPHTGEIDLVRLLQGSSRLPVSIVEEREIPQKSRVYVAPSGGLVLRKGALEALPENSKKPLFTVDALFDSLAAELGEHSVGVILSGAGTDGTHGSAAIKATQGIIIAQDPHTALHRGMPESIISQGLADAILSPEKIVPFLCRQTHQSYTLNEAALQWIIQLIRAEKAFDFSVYKKSVLDQRISRRMSLQGITGVDEYIRLLKESPGEVSSLVRDLQISHSHFLRPRRVFDALKFHLNGILQSKPDPADFQAWVIGCGTGEKAYSLAILVQECLEESGRQMEVRIIGEDTNDYDISRSRKGIYPDSIVWDIVEERLMKYFDRQDSHYTVRPLIRRKIIFARHDFLSEESFLNNDLIIAPGWFKNLNSEIQNRVLRILHRSLLEGGLLLVETGTHFDSGGLFELTDASLNLYRSRKQSGRFSPLPIVPPPHLSRPDLK